MLLLATSSALLTLDYLNTATSIIQALQLLVAIGLGFVLARHGSVWAASGAVAVAMLIAAACFPIAILARGNVAAIGFGPMGALGFFSAFAGIGLGAGALGAGAERLWSRRATLHRERAP